LAGIAQKLAPLFPAGGAVCSSHFLPLPPAFTSGLNRSTWPNHPFEFRVPLAKGKKVRFDIQQDAGHEGFKVLPLATSFFETIIADTNNKR